MLTEKGEKLSKACKEIITIVEGISWWALENRG